MAGSSKKQFIRRGTVPKVATVDEFEERFAHQVATRRHQLIDVPVDAIDPSPFQIRRDFQGIDELAATMREHGFTSHLWVREHPTEPGRYQLIYGERRLRAARMADIGVVPCEVTQADDREMIEIGLTENLQRQDLYPLEEAEGFQRFIDEFDYSIRALAEKIGKDKGYIENRLRLLRMPADVQSMVMTRPDTVSAAREVARLPTPAARAPLIEKLIDSSVSLKAAHSIVDAALDAPEQTNTLIAEYIASQRTDRKKGSSVRSAEHLLDEALDREWSSMVTTISRWQTRVPTLTTGQSRRLQQQIDLLLSELEVLATGIRDQLSLRKDS